MFYSNGKHRHEKSKNLTNGNTHITQTHILYKYIFYTNTYIIHIHILYKYIFYTN